MKTEINLNAYFERTGYEGPITNSLEVLNALHLLHPKAIAFENLNPLLGIPVLLDPESLQQKLVYGNRGGYCFEQNLLLMHVLRALRFQVKGLAARVLWNMPEGRITPRGHMLLLVELEGKRYISDVGFGGQMPTAPLLLEADKVQDTPHGQYQLTRSGVEFTLQSNVKGTWKPLYRFDLMEHFREDYEISNWYLSHHPESHFVTGLLVARPDVNPTRRYALTGNELSTHYMDRETEKHTIKTVAELREILEQIFLVTVPDVPGLNEVLGKLVKKEEMA
jgi:N-hydroxyarylamine O-acetyltransferase